MIAKAEIEDFVRRAEKLNAVRGGSALRTTEKYLDPGYWLSSCETLTEFYIEFHDLVERSQSFLLAHPEGERPAILTFLMTHDLEKRFAPISLDPAAHSSMSRAFGHLTSTVNYLLSRVLTRLLSENPAVAELEPQAEAALEGLWSLMKNVSLEHKEQWQAYEVILHLALGRHDRIIEAYDREYRFDLAQHENSHRTVIKECYMLSRIATGKADGDMAFGAASYINILKLDFYLWRVNDDQSAQMELVPLVVLSLLYEKLVKGRVPNQRDFYASLAPRAVIETMESLRRS